MTRRGGRHTGKQVGGSGLGALILALIILGIVGVIFYAVVIQR